MVSRADSLQRRQVVRVAITYGMAILLVLFLSTPILWIFLTAFKPTVLALTMPPTFVFVLGLPMFVLFMRLGLIDTLIGLTIAYTAFMLPNTIWLMLGFFQALPRSLEEAALVDGCTRFGAFLRIALPLARPGLVVTGFYNAVGAWNHFFYGLTLSTAEARTLPVYAAQLIGEYSIRWGEVSAIGAILVLPPMLLVVLMQRHLSGGLTLGGLKG
jgi:multiple sugar transport system permease protein